MAKEKSKKKKTNKIKNTIDTLADELAKQFGVMVMSEEVADQVPYYIKFQHKGLQAITGGLPGGRFCQIEGDSQSSKSYLLYALMAETLSMGGHAMLIDPEISYESAYGARVGITGSKKFLYSKNKSLERTFDIGRSFIKGVRKFDKDCPILFGVDSYPPLLPNMTLAELDEIKDEKSMKGYVHAKKNNILGIKLGEFVPFLDEYDATMVMINQTRIKLGVVFGDPRTSNAENIIKYYCTLRLRGSLGSKEKDSLGNVIGILSNWETIKNRKIAPFKKVNVMINYKEGVDPVSGLYELLIKQGITKKCKIGKFNGFEFKGKKYKKNEIKKFIEKYPKVLKRIA